jgi:hypothetical protein
MIWYGHKTTEMSCSDPLLSSHVIEWECTAIPRSPSCADVSNSTKCLASNVRVSCLYILRPFHIALLHCGHAVKSRRLQIRATKPNVTKTPAHGHMLHLDYFVIRTPRVKPSLFYWKRVHWKAKRNVRLKSSWFCYINRATNNWGCRIDGALNSARDRLREGARNSISQNNRSYLPNTRPGSSP